MKGWRDYREWVGPVLVTALVLLYWGRLLTGAFPIGHDHPAHLFNAWLTGTHLLPHGHLTGWTELWFAGYPAGELYGPGGSLWVGLFRALSLGLLSWESAYGVALFALMWLLPLSTYALGRTFLGRTAGTIAALLLALTRGNWYDLGWFWIMEMGVWPFALGAAFTMLALVVLRRYLRRGGPRGLLLAALVFALAVLGHPMSLLLLGMAGPIVILYVLLERGLEGATRVIIRAIGAATLGTLLCAFWLVPFVAKSAYSQRLGEIWMSFDEALPAITQLQLFGPEWRLVMGLGAVGFAIAIARRNLWALCLGTTAAVMLLFSSVSTQYGLRLFDVLSPLSAIQYPRFVGFARVVAYLLSGYAIAELGRLLIAAWRPLRTAGRAERLRAVLACALPIALAAPFAADIGDYFVQNHWPEDLSRRTQRQLPWWDDYQHAAAWVKEAMDGQPWSRVGAFGDTHDHVMTMAPLLTGLPVYTGGFVPAHTYRFFYPGERDPALLDALGVRYVIAPEAWGKAHRDARHRAAFGAMHVYERPHMVTPARASAVGACSVVTQSGDDHSLVVVVTNAKGPCLIKLHRADFPNWSAQFEPISGAPTALPISRIAPYPGATEASFMSVVAPGNGVVRVAWIDTRADRAGRAISWAALAVLLVLLAGALRRETWERLRARLPAPSPRGQRLLIRAFWGAAAVGTLVAAFVLINRARERDYTFDRHLAEATKTVGPNAADQRPCTPASTGNGWTCGEGWDRVQAGLFSFVYDNRYCIFAHPSPHGEKRLVFHNVPLEGRLSGFFGLLDTSQGAGPVDFGIQVGDQPQSLFRAEEVGRPVGVEVFTEPGAADVTITITAKRPAWRHLCFNLQVRP